MASNENNDAFLKINTEDVVDVKFAEEEAGQQGENKADILKFNISDSSSSEVFEVDFNQIVNAVVAAMTQKANLPRKSSSYIVPTEIEDIKNALRKDHRIFNQLKDELTDFQNQIVTNHSQKIEDFTEQVASYEREIEIFKATKKEIMMDRLSKMLWPFNEETRKIDNKISTLKIKIERCIQKEFELIEMKPTADEKDILIFATMLKQKYAHLFSSRKQ